MSTTVYTSIKASLLMLAACIPGNALCQEQHLPSIGVLYFTLGDVAQQTAHNKLGISGNLGNDFSRELITRLGGGHKFEVIEMSARPELQKELAILNGANIDASTAARLGKQVGERLVLTGSITELSGGTDVKTFPFYKQETTKVHVIAEVQVIDVETHRVVETAKGVGDKVETKRGPNFDPKSGVATAGNVYGNGPLHDAAAQAIDQIVQKLEASHYLTTASSPPPPPPSVERHAYDGTVADVAGNTVIFTIPSADAAKVGDIVTVQRVVRTIPNPNNPGGPPLRVITETAATAKVTEVDAASSSATAQISSGTVKIKDKISFKP